MSNTSDGPVNNRMMGHNSKKMSWDDRLAANDIAGRYALAVRLMHQTLCDPRLKLSDRKVFATLMLLIPEKGFSQPSREVVASIAGVNVQMVSNALCQLRRFGYIETDWMATDDGSCRTHTFGDEAQRHVSGLVEQIELYLATERKKAKEADDINLQVNPHGLSSDAQVNPQGLSRPQQVNPQGLSDDMQVNPQGLSVVNPQGLSADSVNPQGLSQVNPQGLSRASKKIEKSASLSLEEESKNKGGGVLFSDAELPMVQKADRIRIRAEEIFEEWWSLYPKTRRNGKGDCRDTFVNIATGKHKKRRADAELMLKAIKAGRGIPADLDFAKAPSTYLNQGCWEDDPAVVRSSVFGGNRR